MSDTAVKVENLSKQYKIGVAKHRHDSIRDHLRDTVTSLFHRNGKAKADEGILWALRDVSFEIKQGEVVGIIGRNGAGKSTLLKILSRITEPTNGRAKVYGRLASLLEVGTGFHAELTGRENIYLNGAILGMKKAEIDRKLDEIIAFAEIDKFLETPVKRYSSGMYVRLAFAVAAHLEPEILIIDEVLAVGDAAFQKRCLGKIGSVAKEGRTVVLVSHNMPSVQAMCHRVLLMQNGKLKTSGDANAVISSYLADGVSPDLAEIDLSNHPGRCYSREPALRKAWVLNSDGVKSNSVMMGKSLTVCFEFKCDRPIKTPGYGLGIEDEQGYRIFSLNNYMLPNGVNTFVSLKAGVASLCIDNLPLLPGAYFLTLSLVEDQREWIDCVERALVIHVEPSDVYGSGKIPDQTQGVIYVQGQIRVLTGHDMSGISATPHGVTH